MRHKVLPWLKHAANSHGMLMQFIEALGWFIWGLVKGCFRALWALIRPALKVVSFVLLLAAIIALTSDVTRWQTGAEGPMFESLASTLTQTAPASFHGLGELISLRVHPIAWDPILTSVLGLPAWIVLFGLAIGLGLAARERKEVDIFIN